MNNQRPKHIKKSNHFPNMTKKNNDVTSDWDADYNCIAFAAGITDRKLWPFLPDYYWPQGLPLQEVISSFEKLYESFGYSRSDDGRFEAGLEKIAIFADQRGKPTHAARQIGKDRWASKLGNSYDIEHTQNAVSGGIYGSIVMFMARPKKP